MAREKQQQGGGFQQSAGLIRYFDAEESSAVQIDPRAVIGSGVALSVALLLLQNFFPL